MSMCHYRSMPLPHTHTHTTTQPRYTSNSTVSAILKYPEIKYKWQSRQTIADVFDDGKNVPNIEKKKRTEEIATTCTTQNIHKPNKMDESMRWLE